MILEHRVQKDANGISRFMNEKKLQFDKHHVHFFDWSPAYVILIWEIPDEQVERAEALEKENARLRRAAG